MHLDYAGTVSVGEELTASVTAREKRPDTGFVVFDCDARVGERRVLWGTAVVEAPRRRLSYSEIATPEIILRRNDVFARLLRDFDVEIISTAGTLQVLQDAGIEALSIADFTGVQEMMEGRVK